MDDLLARAAADGLGTALAPFGFQMHERAAMHRGSSVEFVNECLVIAVNADWLEGELAVSVQAVGGRARDLLEVVETTDASLRLTRIKRTATKGMIEEAATRRRRATGELGA